MSAVPLWRFFCGGAFVMRTVAVLLGWSWPSRVIQIFNQISGLLAKQNFLGWSALGDTQWVWRSKADNYRGCTMYRLGGGGHLGDSLFLQRRLHWSISCDLTEKMPVHKSEVWSWEIKLVKIKKSNSAGGLQKGGESTGRDSLGDCGNICEGNLLFRVIFGKFMHRWFLICAQLGSYNVSFLHYRPPKLKYGFFRGSFARLTSQSQAGTLSRVILTSCLTHM